MPNYFKSGSALSLNPNLVQKSAQKRKWIGALALVAIVIIPYEILYLIDFHYNVITQTTLGAFWLLVSIWTAFRSGLRPALVSSIILNVYIVYAYAGPGRHVQPLHSLLENEWALVLVFFLPAALIGYLSDRVNMLLLKERLARYQAEQERLLLTTVLEQMPVGVVIAGAPNGEIIFSNQHLEDILGHSVKAIKSFDDYPVEVLLDDNGSPLQSQRWPISRVLQNHETILNEEYNYHLDDSSKLVLRVKGVPISDDRQQVKAGVIIIDDITADKESEQRKDDFISMVSHELKTPITSLKMYTQLLLKQVSQDPHYNPIEYLQKVDEQTEKLHRMINSMLDLAKVKNSESQANFSPVSVKAIFLETIEELQATNAHRQFVTYIKSNPVVLGDKVRLTQVLSNLMTNALKYSPQQSPITVSLEEKDGQAIIEIKDEGIGISAQDQKRIFERFYQVRHSDGKVYPGLGIGLYFSAEIIKNHGGIIWVDSKKNQGSTFYISLPLAPKS